MNDKKDLVLILHNLRSAYNVGSVFRSADGAGIKKIFLTGYTPQPYDDEVPYYTRAQKMLAKTALGAEEVVAWIHQENISALLHDLKDQKYEIVGLEQDERSVDYRTYDTKNKCALIVGNERDGIDANIRDVCDVLIEIPMCGTKESLNVAVATGIACYRLSDL